jgi:predicted dehydrogenase
VRDWIASGRIGAVTGVTYRFAAPHHKELAAGAPPWRVVAEQSGGGLLLDLGSHTLDLLDWMFGPLGSVLGSAANRASLCDVEDTVAMSFFTAEGVPGTAHWSFASDVRTDCIEVLGTEGHICVPTFGEGPVLVNARGQTQQMNLPNPEHIQQPLIQAIVDELHGNGTAPSTGASGARTSAVMDQVLLSYYGTRNGPFWQTPEHWPGRRHRAR